MAAAGPNKKLCGAKTTRGTCRNVAGKGTDHLGVGRCSRHLGSTEKHRIAAQREIAETQARKALEAEGYEAIANPVDELLRLGSEVVALKDILRGRVAMLSDREWAHENDKGDEEIRAIVGAYERALDRCERMLSGLLKLDLEARQVALAEQQAQVIHRVLAGVLTDLGVKDQREVPGLVRRHLTAAAGR